MEPREIPHAPKVSRLVSTCSPRAAGSAISPMTKATAPAAIIKLPIRDDILKHLYEGDEKAAFSLRLGNLQ
jgi:hypothetical protein